MRTGDFSGLVNSAGILQQLYDPATTQSAANNYARLPFANNQIPISRISPLAKTLYAATPLPHFGRQPSDQLQSERHQQDQPDCTQHQHAPRPRVQREQPRLSPVHRHPPVPAGAAQLPERLAGEHRRRRSPGRRHRLSGHPRRHRQPRARLVPHLLSDVLLGNGHQPAVAEHVRRRQPRLAGATTKRSSAFRITSVRPASRPSTRITATCIMPYGGSQWNYGMNQRLDNLDQNFNMIRASTSSPSAAGIGTSASATCPTALPTPSTSPGSPPPSTTPLPAPSTTPLPNTGYQDADFFLGAASNYTQRRNAPFGRSTLHEFDLYFQDNYRIRAQPDSQPRLSLGRPPRPACPTAVTTPPSPARTTPSSSSTRIEHYYDIGYTTPAIVTNLKNLGAKFMTPQEAGLPDAGFYGSWKNFMPRIGFAWTPVVRHKRHGRPRWLRPLHLSRADPQLGPLSHCRLPLRGELTRKTTTRPSSPLTACPTTCSARLIPVVAGLNSSNVVNSSTVNSLLPGIAMSTTLDAKYPPATVDTRTSPSNSRSATARSSAPPTCTRTATTSTRTSSTTRPLRLCLADHDRHHSAHRRPRLRRHPAVRQPHLGRQRRLH